MGKSGTAVFGTVQNRALIDALRSAGRDLAVIPPPELSILPDGSAPRKSAEALLGFDWLVLTDWMAATSLIQVFRDGGLDLYDLDSVGICAGDESVCDRLRFDRVHSDVVARNSNPSAVAAALNDYAGLGAGLKIMIVGNEDNAELLDEFRKHGDFVDSMTVYRLQFKPGVIARFRTLILGGAFDRLIVNHPSDLAALRTLVGHGAGESPSELVFCSDDAATRRALIGQGVPPSRILPVGR